MRRSFSPHVLLAAVLALAAPAVAQTVEALLLEISLEAELLVEALGRYREARDAERGALSRLANLSARLDGHLERGDTSPSELRRLEGELVDATGIAEARLRRTAGARREVYDRRDRLEVLEQRLAQAGGGPLVPDTGVSGLWQVEIEPGEVFGLMRIEADGTLLAGTYVLSDGGQGSIRGTVIDGEVVIERIDTARGFVDTFEGSLDAASGTLGGRWTGNELAPAGGPTTGTWTGQRLTDTAAAPRRP